MASPYGFSFVYFLFYEGNKKFIFSWNFSRVSYMLKYHSHGRILSYFDYQQNYRQIEGNLKIILHKDRKTPKR